MEQPAGEVRRLEELWSGDFGDDYVDRNAGAYAARGQFRAARMAQLMPQRVLEVGCNAGGNLQWIAEHVSPGGVYGWMSTARPSPGCASSNQS